MHICPDPESITDKHSFLHYAKLFNKYHRSTGLVHVLSNYSPVTVNRICLVQPTNAKGAAGVKMKRNPKENGLFQDGLKGMPPCLQEPLIPLDMVPFND